MDLKKYSCPHCGYVRPDIHVTPDEIFYSICECPNCGTKTAIIDSGDEYGVISTLGKISEDFVIKPSRMVVLRVDSESFTKVKYKAFYEFILAERLTKTAERSGNACHVYVPKSWEGDRVVVYRKPAVDQ